jgi:hypothetical protein
VPAPNSLENLLPRTSTTQFYESIKLYSAKESSCLRSRRRRHRQDMLRSNPLGQEFHDMAAVNTFLPQPCHQRTNCLTAEHLQMMLGTNRADCMDNTIKHYKNCLRVIFDNTPIIPQTSKTTKNQPLTSLTPNYLCLQCTVTTTERDRIAHGTETGHRLCNFST